MVIGSRAVSSTTTISSFKQALDLLLQDVLVLETNVSQADNCAFAMPFIAFAVWGIGIGTANSELEDHIPRYFGGQITVLMSTLLPSRTQTTKTVNSTMTLQLHITYNSSRVRRQGYSD